MNGLISLVIPVYNEAGSLAALLAEIDTALSPLARPYEVVFVDDGSTDRSFAIMEELAGADERVRIVKMRRNFGKAAALAHGFAACRGEAVVTLDGDRQDDPAEIPKLLAALDAGHDLVSGWKQSRQDPITKTLPSRFFNWTVRKSTGIPLHDFNCGLKAYRREVVENVAIYGELHRYIPVVAAQQGFRVTEEKVAHRRRTSGRSKYGWQRYLRGYLDLLTVLFLGRFQSRPQHLFGGLGTAMITAGVIVDGYLAVDKIAFGHAIGQRPLLLLGTLLIIVGIQLVSLGLLSELIAYRSAREGLDRYQVEREVSGEEARADAAARAAEQAAQEAATPRRAAAELHAAEEADRRAAKALAAEIKAEAAAGRGAGGAGRESGAKADAEGTPPQRP
jgi:glycosyltransferase involved in cell wall biosynthesis